MKLVDTNILLSYLTGDDKIKKMRDARRFCRTRLPGSKIIPRSADEYSLYVLGEVFPEMPYISGYEVSGFE